MEKIYQILAVTVLLFLLIRFFYYAQEDQIRPYQLSHRHLLAQELTIRFLVIDPVGRYLFLSGTSAVLVMPLDQMGHMRQIFRPSGLPVLSLGPEIDRVFVGDGTKGGLTSIDVQTLEKKAYDAGTDIPCTGILYEPFSKQLFIWTATNLFLSVHDPEDLSLKDRIDLPGIPVIAMSDNAGKIIVQIAHPGMILVIDSILRIVLHQWDGGIVPVDSVIALDKKNHLLFAAAGSKGLTIWDYLTGIDLTHDKSICAAGNMVFDEETSLLYFSDTSGSLSIMKQGKDHAFKKLQAIPQTGEYSFVVDAKTKRLIILGVQPTPEPVPVPQAELRIYSIG